MGIVVYSLLWVMQDVYHQPYHLQNQASRTTLLSLMGAQNPKPKTEHPKIRDPFLLETPT